ncbi:N-succinylarginine dihydrolase [Amphritea balenae]|uniref:N-succinylarginine dihydrolase n=1 Tax=Amphritea balenae TaxID=452629 RepID=A0A3P1SPA6_9GAMM|nr:N-succinylarginine dihydrolase [Amphritea balenae]RRC98976.1 N-succinylarginine dihydrolase [Amphritea balenae]GGK63348.1 N-succinylarginine dihydrolase [Amphritea balenae]
MRYQEANFDGLIGPSHNFAGLSPGNLASNQHKGEIAYPKQAALQGLEKMWMLQQLGIPQGVLPPLCRPDLDCLRKLGFSGDNNRVISHAGKQAPHLLAACYSAAAMWTANSATVTCSKDSPDGRVNFTPANLLTAFHRSLETSATATHLQRIFSDPSYFHHHPALPAQSDFADEGAANHTRLSESFDKPGINLLVYGRSADNIQPLVFPARQTRAACEAIVRQHGLAEANTLLAQQNPEVIDQGVFHHDVIGVGQQNFLMLHQRALLDQKLLISKLKRKWQALYPKQQKNLVVTEFSDSLINVQEAVDSYLFNSQLLTLPDSSMLLLAPSRCAESSAAQTAIDWLLAEKNPVSQVAYAELTQSMNNGGGPACLRLRVTLSDKELNAVHRGVMLDFTLYTRLKGWIETHYRDQLSADDLTDPRLILEIHTALDELSEILDLPLLYPFQV